MLTPTHLLIILGIIFVAAIFTLMVLKDKNDPTFKK